MSEVVHGIDSPLRPRAVMRYLDDAVDDGVTEVHVGRSHIDLRAKDHRAFLELARIHPMEEVQTLLSGSITEGACRPSGSGRTLLSRYLFGCLLIDISMTGEDELLGEAIQAIEVVRSIEDLSPVEA